MSAQPADAIRCDALSQPVCDLLSCGKPYQRVRRHQRFCSPECKAAFHDPDNVRVRGTIKGNRAIKGGHSITIHVPDGADVSRFLLGAIAEIL